MNTSPEDPQSPAELWNAAGSPPASEGACLALIDELFPSRTVHTPAGRGDDCAVLRVDGGRMVLSTDMFWEDVHFRRSYFTPQEAGAKALSAAVSDLAAAGAVPLGFSLGLLLPPRLSASALRLVMEGMSAAAARYGIILSGGDLAKGDVLGFSVTVWGGAHEPAASFLCRRQARPGDVVFLIGPVGLARAGLLALERRGRGALELLPACCRAHLAPQALLAEGQAVAEVARAFAGADAGGSAARPCLSGFSLMDVSDGLVRDLPRLLGPLGVELDVDPALVPLELHKAEELLGIPAEELFLLGGEDYALLGTCPMNAWPALSAAVPAAVRLGRAAEAPGLRLRGRELRLSGFDHFSVPPAAFSAGSGTKNKACLSAADVPAGFSKEAAAAVPLLVEAGREAWEAGLMAGFNGNISCRVVEGRKEQCVITRSGAAKGRMGSGDFCLLDLPDGERLAGPAASTESGMHTAIYRGCPESRWVLHCHAPHLLALSLLVGEGDFLALPLPESESYRARLARAAFYPPGTAALAEAVAAAATTAPAVWMERHGLVVHGPDASFVLSLSEELEQLAKVQLAVLQKG